MRGQGAVGQVLFKVGQAGTLLRGSDSGAETYQMREWCHYHGVDWAGYSYSKCKGPEAGTCLACLEKQQGGHCS